MKKLALLLVSMAFVFALASNSMAWTLVYANDSNGAATYGNIQQLINAVRNGKAIRFVIGDSLAMDGQTVGINNNTVYAQNTSHISIEGTGPTFFQDPPYYAYFLINTTGDLHISRWFVSNHSPNGTDVQKVSVKWFADKD